MNAYLQFKHELDQIEQFIYKRGWEPSRVYIDGNSCKVAVKENGTVIGYVHTKDGHNAVLRPKDKN